MMGWMAPLRHLGAKLRVRHMTASDLRAEHKISCQTGAINT
jgi:hypothetical protein